MAGISKALYHMTPRKSQNAIMLDRRANREGRVQRFEISVNFHTLTAYRKKTVRLNHGDTTNRFALEQDV